MFPHSDGQQPATATARSRAKDGGREDRLPREPQAPAAPVGGTSTIAASSFRPAQAASAAAAQ